MDENNTHFNFVWTVGALDLDQGFQSLTATYSSDTLHNPLVAQYIIVAFFVFVVVSNVAFFIRVFQPWLVRPAQACPAAPRPAL